MLPQFTIPSLLILYIVNTQIILYCIPTAAFAHDHSKGNETDRLALLAIKSKITRDPHGVLESWNESSHFCMWQGVTCGLRHRRVTVLNISSSGLVGTLSPSIGNLSFLHSLYLYNNSFKGHIPPEVGRLFRLESLNFRNNSFEGDIPTNISGCVRLNFIDLINNKLIGKLPSEFSFLSRLETLSLGQNNLTGDDLSPLENLTSLQVLNLARPMTQGFHGSVPDFIGNFKHLRRLYLGGNSFTGTIPPSLYNLSNLQVLSLASNLLEGGLPSNLGFNFPQLFVLQMSDNQLSGPVPVSLSNLTNLIFLDLHNNNFTGKLIFDGRMMPNLLRFDLGTAIMGREEADELDFLNTLVNCTYLQFLIADTNNLGGNLPHSIANLSVHLKEFVLSYNFISGSLPLSGLDYLLSLEIFGLSDNQLTGSIPADIGKIPKLQSLYLYNNLLSGSIPSSLGNLSWLSILDIEVNKFHGFVPPTLGNCTNLLEIYLGHNNLIGNIPHQLFQASGLIVIFLDNTNLQGSLPSEINKLQNLVVVDMSSNKLSGSIPSSFGQCITLTHLNLQGNFFKGFIPPSFSLLKSLEVLDLSNNKLSGQVPKYFANLSFLTYLNLSFNNLEGEVPTKGIFANASELFLIGNEKLCGGIAQLKLPTCPMERSKKRRKSYALIISISVSCLIVGLIFLSFAFLACKKQKKVASCTLETMNEEPFTKVSYDMLLKATNGFSPDNLIGSGSFSSVYKGNLLLNGTDKLVAIKVINNQHQGANQSFLVECEALRVIRHRNLVKVITACSSIDYQGNVFNAIVYDLMKNGSLERWLYSNPEVNDHQFQCLSLVQRLNIAIDIAHAVDYIHNGCETPFVHCDLKPTNILLDDDLVAHVGDFGLVKLPPEIINGIPDYSSLGVRGTVGYAAPEYALGVPNSAAGDVYSFGIILLELMIAKKPTDVMFEGEMSLHKFAESVLPNHMLKILDPNLEYDNFENRNIELDDTRVITKCAFECIRLMIMIGVKCSSESPQDRMDIKDVIRQLESQKRKLLGCGRHHRCQLVI